MFDISVLTAGTYHSECEAWPAPPTRDEPWLSDVEGIPETLVVSVTGDPVTPHKGGITMAKALGGSLLTVDGRQHGAYLLDGSKCVDDAVNTYLLALKTRPPAPVAACDTLGSGVATPAGAGDDHLTTLLPLAAPSSGSGPGVTA